MVRECDCCKAEITEVNGRLQGEIDFERVETLYGKAQPIAFCDTCIEDMHYSVCDMCDEPADPYDDMVIYNSYTYHYKCFQYAKQFIERHCTVATPTCVP